MKKDYADILEKRFAKIKRIAVFLFIGLVAMLSLCAAADLPAIEGPEDIRLALLITIIIIIVCGMFFSRLHKIELIKTLIIGRDADAVNEKKLKKASGIFQTFILLSFVSWFNLGAWGIVGTVFLGGKIWLAGLGIPAILMMLFTWPKKNDLISFVTVD